MSKTKYISCSETAKLVRQALKHAFPNHTFYVRSNTYAGGASIDVIWHDGPCTPEVDQIVQRFGGKSFDGSIDMGCYWRHWLLPDGTIELAKGPGTEGSHGYIPSIDNPQPHPDAELVSFGADYVFTKRYTSPELVRDVGAWVFSHVIQEPCEIREWTYPITKSKTWNVAGFVQDYVSRANEDYHYALHWTSVIDDRMINLQELFAFWDRILEDAGYVYGDDPSALPLVDRATEEFLQLDNGSASRLHHLFLAKHLRYHPQEVPDAKV